MMNTLMRSTQESWQEFSPTQKVAALATNALTLSRPVITGVVSQRGIDTSHDWSWADTSLLTAGYLTDLEGGIARLYGAQTKLGGVLDPLADKIATNTQEFTLVARGEESFTRASLRLGRDIGISALRSYALDTSDGTASVGALTAGKLNTAFRKSAIIFASSPLGEKYPTVRTGLQYASLATTLLSGAITARRLLERKNLSKTAVRE